MSVSMRPRGAPLARFPAPPVVPSLFAGGSARTGSDGGYPWHDGELLYAADLNAAITASSVSVLDLGAKGDGLTDDTSAIQNALNTYAGKATVIMPNTGNSYMVSSLTLPSQIDLLLLGSIMAQANAPAAPVIVEGVNNVTIRGNGSIHGNFAGNPNPPGGMAGLAIDTSTNVRVSGITVQDARHWPINVTACDGVWIDGIRMIGGQNSPEFAQGSNNCWLMNSYQDGPEDDGGFTFYSGVTNSGAIGNVFTGAFIYGCSIANDTIHPPPCSGITISNNIVFNNRSTGIAVLVNNPGLAVHTDITISNNVLYDNNTSGQADIPAQYFYPCDIAVSSCAGVVVSGNQMSGTKGHGIVIGGYYANTSGVTVTGNDISNEGQGSRGGFACGIFISPPLGLEDIAVIGNHIYDTQTTPTMTYGIYGECGVRSGVLANQVGPMITAAVQVIGPADFVLSVPTLITFNNVGYGLPTLTTRSAGTKLVLSPTLTSTTADVAIGVGPASTDLWFSLPTASGSTGFSFYGGTTQVAYITGLGGLNMTGLNYIPGFGFPINATNDAAAAAANVSLGGVYRNGSVMMVRVT